MVDLTKTGKPEKKTGRKSKNDSDNPGNSYVRNLFNLAKSARAWRAAFMAVVAVLVIVLWMLRGIVNDMPVRLIPYDYAINKGISSVPEIGVASPEYASRIAIADISLYSNWTPNTVGKQFRRFLNRCAPELYSNQQPKLINLAEEYSNGNRSRAFFPRRTSVNEGPVVKVTGELRRYEGDQLLSSRLVTYSVEYRLLHGVPYIHRIQQQEQS